MDYLSFIAKIIESLAWPASVVIVVAMLKEGIVNLLPKLRQLKYKDLQLEFDESVRKIETQAEAANLPLLETTTGHEQLRKDKESLFNLAQSYPRAALFEAWVKLEVAIGQGLRNAQVITDGEKRTAKYQPFEGAKVLFAEHPKQFQYFGTLRNLRNKVAHGEVDAITINSACAFIEMSFRLILFIENTWPNSPPNTDAPRA